MSSRVLLTAAVSLVLTATGTNAQSPNRTIDFAAEAIGKPAAGFTCARTGRGKPGTWVVAEEADGAAKVKALAQTDKDATSFRFPVCVVDGLTARNVDLSVRFLPVSGEVDQAAGLVWRYKDADNYYIVRANALEDNVVLYKVEKGKRSDLALVGQGKTYGAKAPVPKKTWGTLRVTAEGDLFTVFLNGTKLYEVKDATFKDAGQVGVWTKADSVTLFTALTVAGGK